MNDDDSRELRAAQIQAYRQFAVAAMVLFDGGPSDQVRRKANELQAAAADVALLGPEPVHEAVAELTVRASSPLVRYARLAETQSSGTPALVECQSVVEAAIDRTINAVRNSLHLFREF